MPKVALYNVEGNQVGEVELSDTIFGIEVNAYAVHQVVTAQLNNQRQGTQSALTRSEVSGGGAKPWRQKGTGRARAGTSRSPLWKHGGVVFAPKPRDYATSVNKKVRRLAMKSALTAKVNENELLVLDALSFADAKTKEMVKVLKNLNVESKALVVLSEKNELVERAAHNIPGVKTTHVGTLNVLDIVNYNKFIVTQDAVKKIEEVYV